MADYKSEEQRRLSEFARKHWNIDSYVLPDADATKNLYEGFCNEVLKYFEKNAIEWWAGKNNAVTRSKPKAGPSVPTGNLCSSQIACVNHLEPARIDADFALSIAQQIDADIVEMVEVEDGGFVAFEAIGGRNYLEERGGRTRGANITSLDAMMVGRRSSGAVCLLAFEWKYLESYGNKSVAISKHGTNRVETYSKLIGHSEGPIVVGDPEWLFYDPYYQLMRQTLLAWQMVVAQEFGSTDWIHVNVIPERNVALRNRVQGCAPQLIGETMASVWKSVLRAPDRYRLMSPSQLLPAAIPTKWLPWRLWLKERYLT